MNPCPEPMLDLVYGEPDPETRIALTRHRSTCAVCRREYETLKTMASALEVTSVAAPDLDDILAGNDLERVDLEPRRMAPVWLAVAALLLISLLFFWKPQEADSGPQMSPELAVFFERSQPFLLALANVTPDLNETPLAELVREDRARAARLAEEALALRQEAHTLKQRNLLADIELLLLQVANLRETEYRRGLEMVRTYMDRRTLLFELSLLIETV